MKILMPVLHYPPVIGGLETWTQNIARRLADRAEVFVVAGKVKGQPKQEIKDGVKIFRTSLFFLKNLSHSSGLYIVTALPFIFLKSFSLIKKEKINIVHCQGFLSSLLGFLLFKIYKLPYVVTVQRQENKNWLKKIVYKNAAYCIGASEAIKKYFQEIGCKNIEVIPNGIDVDKFKVPARNARSHSVAGGQSSKFKVREKLGLNNEFVIVTVARLENVKGIDYLIKSLQDLIKNFQFSIFNFQLLIIGEGSERKNLEDLTKELNLQDKVRFLGEIPNGEVPQYLAAADCFVLPSLAEGFGIVILEAMAADLPVIATNVGGIPDIIEHGKTGILVEPKNPKQIAEAITKIYSRPEFAQNLAKNARENLARYDWDNITKRVYNIYSCL